MSLPLDQTEIPATDRDGIRVLIVDDDPLVRESLALGFEPLGHSVTTCSSGEHARAALAEKRFDLIVLDLLLNDISGLDLIPELVDLDPSAKIVVLTAFGSVETAVHAMRRGAFDYLTKPVTTSELQVLAARVAERRNLEQRLQVLEEDVRHNAAATPILDSSNPAMARAINLAREVSATDATVLINGESGTGKGVLARAIHDWSHRSARPFAAVNCPALSTELLRSELFGHVRGSFTGATDTKVGKIEFADGGTLFLDEVGLLSAEIQPRLLRFLQDKEYERVGDPKPRHGDVRLIAATNRDLQQAVTQGEFRDDLYYRLNVINIQLVPLRARKDDIPVLAYAFLRFFGAKYGKPLEGFTDEALDALRNQPWPGNVRELQNAVERAVILARSTRIGASILPRTEASRSLPGMTGTDKSSLTTLKQMEARYIKHVIEVTESIDEAASVLGVAPSTLWRLRRKHGI
jgi:NtrC-family two-component system response regulator AlgB